MARGAPSPVAMRLTAIPSRSFVTVIDTAWFVLAFPSLALSVTS